MKECTVKRECRYCHQPMKVYIIDFLKKMRVWKCHTCDNREEEYDETINWPTMGRREW